MMLTSSGNAPRARYEDRPRAYDPHLRILGKEARLPEGLCDPAASVIRVSVALVLLNGPGFWLKPLRPRI